MSILNSTYNSFIFNFPKTFIPEQITSRWDPYIKRISLPYDTVTHFLNSTIQAIDFPNTSMDTVQQMKKFKEKEFKNSKDPQDLFEREFNITFKTTEGFANYWIMQEIFASYVDFNNKNLYLDDLYLRMIDQDGYILSTVKFQNVIMTGLTGINLSYADNVPEFKAFDATFRWNFIDIEITTGARARPDSTPVAESADIMPTGRYVTVENSDDTYSKNVSCGDKHELPDITHIDSDGSSVPTPAQTAFISTLCESITIENSDDSYSEIVFPGATHELPDITHTDSDGSSSILPAQTAFISTLCESVTVENSDDSYSEIVFPGATHELPDITHTDSDGSPAVLPAQTAFVASICQDATVENSDDSYSETVASGAKHELPDIIHLDNDGTPVPTPAQTVFACSSCDDATVENSDDSYSETVASGAKHELPDVNHIDSDGSPIATPGQKVFVASVCQDATVENSDDSYSETVAPGAKHELPDVNHIDSDGSPIATPGQKIFTCTPATALEDNTCQQLNDGLTSAQRQVIQSVYLIQTGQVASYVTDDDGDLERGRLVDFSTLSCNNPFGNTNRRTDSVGGQVYGAGNGSIADYMIDHATGLGWQFNTGFTLFGTSNWATAMAAAAAYDNGTYSNFIIPNWLEINTLYDFSNLLLLDYAPLNYTTITNVWNSTTNPRTTTKVNVMATTGTPSPFNKTSFARYLYVRTHY